MQLGFVSAILPELSLEELMTIAAEIGYDCVEVMCWPPSKAERRYAGVTHINTIGFDDAQAAEVHAICERTGVAISGLGFYPNPLDPDPEVSGPSVEHIRSVIAACKILGIPQMNTFVGRDWKKSIDDNWPRFVETWKPLVAFAGENGVRIGIENCPMSFTNDEWPGGKNLANSPSVWRRMYDEIPDENFGLNYDPSHMIWQQMDYLQPLTDFASRMFHVHAKDVRLDQDRLDDVGILATPHEYHTPKLPGMGDVNWGQFFSILTDSGYDGPVCVEVEDRAYEGSLGARKAALVQSHTFLRNYCP
ncbi:MAG: AP endonuclease [Planctomycetaceae bacterium]|nr:AP endonuclease [Planctomycetaceae bacterium]